MRYLNLLSILTVAVTLVAACGPAATPAPATTAPVAPPPTSAPPTAAPPTAKPTAVPPTPAPRILKVAGTASVTTWDPSASFSTEAAYLANLYEPLLWVNPPDAKDKYAPALAEKWEHSDDFMTWTFHLRKGIKFHDGAELNADAVIKSISRTITLGQGAAFIWAPVATMESPDPMTVVFKL